MSLGDKIIDWKTMSEKEFKEQKSYRINHLKSAVKGNYEVELEHRIDILNSVEEYIKEFIKDVKKIVDIREWKAIRKLAGDKLI